MRTGVAEYVVYEEALRRYLGWNAVEAPLKPPSELTEEAAMQIALQRWPRSAVRNMPNRRNDACGESFAS